MIWITNGKICKRIQESCLQEYLQLGFRRGKKLDNKTITAWNKGLTTDDSRVASYVHNKPKTYRKKVSLCADECIVFENGYTISYEDELLLCDAVGNKWKVIAKKCN